MFTCRHCGQPVEPFRRLWWSADDDFMCPDGETQHQVTRGATGDV
jgi:hypothetical protein